MGEDSFHGTFWIIFKEGMCMSLVWLVGFQIVNNKFGDQFPNTKINSVGIENIHESTDVFAVHKLELNVPEKPIILVILGTQI